MLACSLLQTETNHRPAWDVFLVLKKQQSISVCWPSLPGVRIFWIFHKISLCVIADNSGGI